MKCVPLLPFHCRCSRGAQAAELLRKNLATAVQNLEAVKGEVHTLRDSITTTEVTIARVYNYDVARRRSAGKAAEAGA